MALVSIALLTAPVLACARDKEPTSTDMDDEIALGQEVYQANCATCRGVDGEGQPNWQSRRPDGTLPAPPHDSSGHTWHHSDADLIEIIQRGGQAVYGGENFQSGMPAWGERLTEDEIRAVLEYIKTLWAQTSGSIRRPWSRSLGLGRAIGMASSGAAVGLESWRG